MSNEAGRPLAGIIIVNYNCAEDTLTCLRSLKLLDYPNYFVVVVDNSSTDRNTAGLAASVRKLGHVFILSPENRGFAGANNIGIQYCRASDALYAWLLNPDTVTDPSALTAFVDAAEKEPNTAFGGKVLYGSLNPEEALRQAAAREVKNARIWSAGGGIDSVTHQVSMFGSGETDTGAHDQERSCDYIPGCSLFFPLDILGRAGFMPEKFFMYFEETEWCADMAKAGIHLKYLPGSVIWHRFVDEKLQGRRTVYYYNRNQLFFWYHRLAKPERWKMLWEVFTKKIPELRRAEKEAPNDELRQVFAAHQLACWDFLFGRMGRRADL